MRKITSICLGLALAGGLFIGGAAATALPAQACNWSEAKIHIDWALNRDSGRQYHRSRKCGSRVTIVGQRIAGDECLSKFDALMEAQSHNPTAIRAIRRCEAQTKKFLADHG